jgi:catechol 2,3-dioxygenase-like lactoylglutathione lyase family enzyme
MRSSAHVALRVADIERSTQFYLEALSGEVVMDIALKPDFVQSIFGAPPGMRGHNRFIAFSDFSIEIYEFTPSSPIPAMDQTAAGITHFCLMVPDVLATLELVERSGGRALFPVRPFGKGRHFVYVTDPDGHIVELLDATLEECIEWVGAGTLPDHTRSAHGGS